MAIWIRLQFRSYRQLPQSESSKEIQELISQDWSDPLGPSRKRRASSKLDSQLSQQSQHDDDDDDLEEEEDDLEDEEGRRKRARGKSYLTSAGEMFLVGYQLIWQAILHQV